MNSSKLFVASWALLLLLAAALTLFSVGSAAVAHLDRSDDLTPTYAIAQLREASPEAATSVRARRLTAATWALGYALLLAFVVAVPYRRGERWVWWALLVSLGVAQALSLARLATIPESLGSGAPGVLLVILAIALLLGAPRMFGRSAA